MRLYALASMTASVTLPEGSPTIRASQAVARARAAQLGWGELSVRTRVKRLAPLKNRVLDRAEAIAACVREEVGKPDVEVLLGEVLPSADVVAYWRRSIEDLLEPAPVDLDRLSYPDKFGTIFREPRGVVGVLMPYNFPVALPLRTLVPALLAGNAVVFKPSEVTPRSGELVRDLFAGLLPDGVLEVLQGDAQVGAALCATDVDLVVFTGSVATGRKVARACAERLVPCSLELGGKDAAIVLRDANLDRAANGVVWGAMTNAGQNCASIERVYVDRHVGEAFIGRVRTVVASLRPGIEVAPLATSSQEAIVAGHVRDALARGAEVVIGSSGEASAGAFAPTVVRVDSDDMPLMREETFGPVLPIALVDGPDEAIARANASRYGLTASLWTRDLRAARRLARRLRAGVVTVNNHAFTGALPAAPWSGYGESGWGVTNSPLALDALTRPRFVLVDKSRARRDLWWYPYTPALRTIGTKMAIVRSSRRNPFARLAALVALVGAFLGRWRTGPR
jgi:acyl-CoA reductase-like NAD-dependent aldehyde dehydrogenase